jgi:hypothetical protein
MQPQRHSDTGETWVVDAREVLGLKGRKRVRGGDFGVNEGKLGCGCGLWRGWSRKCQKTGGKRYFPVPKRYFSVPERFFEGDGEGKWVRFAAAIQPRRRRDAETQRDGEERFIGKWCG